MQFPYAESEPSFWGAEELMLMKVDVVCQSFLSGYLVV